MNAFPKSSLLYVIGFVIAMAGLIQLNVTVAKADLPPCPTVCSCDDPRPGGCAWNCNGQIISNCGAYYSFCCHS